MSVMSTPRKSSTNRRESVTGSGYADRIKQVIEYINDNLDGDLSLQQLSRIAGFSPFHFHRQFATYSGITVARLVKILRLQRASLQLAFNPNASVIEIALEAGYTNPESFSKAFKQMHGLSPSEFRRTPHWSELPIPRLACEPNTLVDLIDFPGTNVAAVEYLGPESQVYSASMKLVEWRREHGVSPDMGSTYGVLYTDPSTTPTEAFRMDICVSYKGDILHNKQGVIAKLIPGGRCARIRHFGSRDYIPETAYLYGEWLPSSNQKPRDYPIFFHYVNVGPNVQDKDMVTYVYLPIR